MAVNAQGVVTVSPRIACVGGGPGGLFFASLIKDALPDSEVTVFERNRADDTFGFGVVFSDATLAGINDVSPVLRDALECHGVRWDQIEVRAKNESWSCAGMGMSAIRRKTLLTALQERALSAGVEIRFETEVDLEDLDGYDLVVACDGANSRIRDRFADVFRPSAEMAKVKFIWFGTTYAFDGLTFVHEAGPDGPFAVHGYPIGEGLSTFIVETDEETWKRAGLDEFDVSQPPGASDLKSKEYLEKLFAEQIDGHPLVVNNSRWGNFRTRRADRWYNGNLVLLGDSAHTAHFSVGSGTKMAMEDAIALAAAVANDPADIAAALMAYELAARPSVERIQDAARPSLAWWEYFGLYREALEPWQFSFHFLSRSITAAKLARRDPDYVRTVRDEWRQRHGVPVLDTPFVIRNTTFASRVLAISDTGDACELISHDAARGKVRLRATATPGRPGETWALLVDAPADEASLLAAFADLAQSVSGGPDAVVIRGGSRLTRTRLAEQARLVERVPTVVVELQLDRDDAETLVLSGRTDLVATDASVLAGWGA
jgi:2-polyprenyl-6-methoxyphenol hydroxylase-like FAD-dependent oxidoreductase